MFHPDRLVSLWLLWGRITAMLLLNRTHYVYALASLPIRKATPPPLSSELGCSPTLSFLLRKNCFFDPLNLATDHNFAWYREAELKHGRVAMLATLGMVFPRVLVDNLLTIQLPLVKKVADYLVAPPHKVYMGCLEAVQNMTWQGWLEIFVTCGLLESFVFCQRSATDMPGDYGTGYLGLRDKAKHERSLQCELENGRLAMIAFVVQVVYELVTGVSVAEQMHLTGR